MVTSLSLCVASMDRKWVRGVIQQPTITINMERIAFTEGTFGECFHKAAIVKLNGNVRLEVIVTKSVH
jgi:hypothetical protein